MVRAAIVLNEGGLAVATDRLPPENIFRRPTQRPASIRPIPIKPRIGVATNAFFNASPDQRAMLARLRRQLGASKLYLRLHPTSNLAEGGATDTWLVVVPSDESLEAYAGRLDIVVVGNSAVQLRLVQKGIPVIHVDGLDSLSFDLYGYVADKIVFGCEDVTQLSLQEVKSFYESDSLGKQLQRLTYLSDETAIQGLQKIRSIFQAP